MTFLIKVGSDKQKQITNDDIITAKLAAKAYDLVYKIMDKKQASPINASQVANIRVNSTQGGLIMKTSNYNKFPTTIISVHRKIATKDAEMIQEAQ